MLERRILILIIAILSAYIIYDRHTTTGQHEAIVERQRDFEVRTLAEVKKLDNKAAEVRIQNEADTRAHELELKKLELEIKRAEAEDAAALSKQKEIDVREAQKKRADELAEQAAERGRMDAETAREENKRAEVRKHAADIRNATQERVEASRRLNDLAWKKQTAQRLVIAWRNKLQAAEHSREKSDLDLINAQAQPNGASSAAAPRRRYDPLEGPDPSLGQGGGGEMDGSSRGQNRRSAAGPSVIFISSNREAVENAQAQQLGAAKAIDAAKAALAKAQEDLTRFTADYESALTAKQSADRRLAQLAPPQPQNRVFATYSMLDGRKLEAICVIESGDDIWVKTGSGIETIKRADVELVARADDAKNDER